MIKKIGNFFLEIIEIVVFSISIFLFLYLLVVQPHKIQGSSMEPNFHDGQYLLTDKITYRFNEPQVGDVIVFKAPPDFQDEYIKRIIAIPGEKITIKNNQVYKNGDKFSESYIPQETDTNAGKFAQEEKSITIPQGEYFVMGDNRQHSLDSRSFGFVKLDNITGRAWLIYWPPTDFGTI